MTLPLSVWLLMALATMSGLLAGVFLTFSDFVMKSLHAAAPTAGTQSMQIVNRLVYRSFFMALFIAMIPLSVLLIGYGVLYADGPVAGLLIAAGALYFGGVFVVTAIGNVPMNNTLAALPDGGTAAQAYWPDYVKGWLRWNHIRAVAATGSAICLMLAASLTAQAA